MRISTSNSRISAFFFFFLSLREKHRPPCFIFFFLFLILNGKAPVKLSLLETGLRARAGFPALTRRQKCVVSCSCWAVLTEGVFREKHSCRVVAHRGAYVGAHTCTLYVPLQLVRMCTALRPVPGYCQQDHRQPVSSAGDHGVSLVTEGCCSCASWLGNRPRRPIRLRVLWEGSYMHVYMCSGSNQAGIDLSILHVSTVADYTAWCVFRSGVRGTERKL